MRLQEIIKIPTVIKEIPDGSTGVHESCVRSYQILNKVKYYLSKNVPNDIIIELIDELENKYDYTQKLSST